MNRTAITLALVALVFTLIGGVSNSDRDYQLASRSQGVGVWRLDTKTGEVCLVTFRQTSRLEVFGCVTEEKPPAQEGR